MKSPSIIKLSVELDSNKVPKKIFWEASDLREKKKTTNSFLLSLWDNETNNTLKINLWTKEMLMHDMKKFIHQTMFDFVDILKKSTGEEKSSKELEDFLIQFAKTLKIAK